MGYRKPEDITKPKVMEGKTFWWCERYKMWAINKPEDCKYPEDLKKETKEKAENKKKKLVEASEVVMSDSE